MKKIEECSGSTKKIRKLKIVKEKKQFGKVGPEYPGEGAINNILIAGPPNKNIKVLNCNDHEANSKKIRALDDEQRHFSQMKNQHLQQ